MAVLKTKMPNLSDWQWIPRYSYSDTDVPDLISSEEDESDTDTDDDESDTDTDEIFAQAANCHFHGELPLLPTLRVSGDNGGHFRVLCARHAYNQCDGSVTKFRTATSDAIVYQDFVTQ